MIYYSAIKKEGNSTIMTIEMTLEDIMLSEISQPQKDKYSVIPLILKLGDK